MSSDNVYYEILDYDGSEDRNWFGYAWRSIKNDDFDDVERLLEERDSAGDGLGDLEVSLLIEIFKAYDESNLRPYTVKLADEYDVRDDSPKNSFA
ncbi:MAG: hypothetical protein R6V35_01680 [Candidatus Nanohaloarchaea archaeon]